MGAVLRPGASWVLPAEPSAVSELRHQAAEFASTSGASDEVTEAIALAVSETVTNAVVHAYAGEEHVTCGVLLPLLNTPGLLLTND